MEMTTSLIAFVCGGALLTPVTSGSVGFRFLGVTFIVIGVAFAILLLGSCIMAGHPQDQTLVTEKFMSCSTPLMLVLLALGIFALAVSSSGGGVVVPGRSYKEYHVDSYSKWMQNKINQNWDTYYKDAVNNGQVCSQIVVPDYFWNPYPAFKSGCCEPPQDCNFNSTNQIIQQVWIKPEQGNYTNDDCSKWDNDPNTLCFNCESCKAGFLQDVTSRWLSIGVVLVIVAVFLFGLIYLQVATN